MNCEKCGEPIHDSGGGEYVTLVGHMSPPGHNHDDNCKIRSYVCSNGHMVAISKRRKCPKCDWVGKSECFCHPGKKVDEWPE